MPPSKPQNERRYYDEVIVCLQSEHTRRQTLGEARRSCGCRFLRSEGRGMAFRAALTPRGRK